MSAPVPQPRAAAAPAGLPVGSPVVSSVAVVICTFSERRLAQVVAAARSVQAQEHPVAELLVVVDGTEALADLVRAELPDVRLVCLGRNQGVAAARTRGVQEVGSEVVAFLDDDAVADPGWVGELLPPLADPAVVGVSGCSVADFGAPRPAWLPDEFLWTVGCSYRGLPTEVAPVRNFYGGCAVVRRSTFLEVGGFHDGIGHHGGFVGGSEEADFCLRATARTGGVFMYAPRARIHHRVPRERLALRYYLRRCVSEGVVKAHLSGRLADDGAVPLGPERDFALEMPRAVLRCLLTRGERGRALGVLVGVLAVLVGLAVGGAGRLFQPSPTEERP